MWLCNSIGIIDVDYLGIIKVKFVYDGFVLYCFDWFYVGDCIVQVMLVKNVKIELIEVEEIIKEIECGENGFGSIGW